jgi:hypothetical protein
MGRRAREEEPGIIRFAASFSPRRRVLFSSLAFAGARRFGNNATASFLPVMGKMPVSETEDAMSTPPAASGVAEGGQTTCAG